MRAYVCVFYIHIFLSVCLCVSVRVFLKLCMSFISLFICVFVYASVCMSYISVGARMCMFVSVCEAVCASSLTFYKAMHMFYYN